VSLILDEHRHYLADHPRITAYERALAATVRPGDIVLDLASGTSVLGILACRAGAARVYSIDDGSIIQVARELARANGVADRMVFIREFSTRTTLPEPVDVIVCDQMGHMGFEAGVLEYVRDAKQRMLKRDGRSIPQSIAFEVAGLESDDLRDRLDFWERRPAGLDVTPARGIALNTGYPALVAPQQLLTDGAVIARTDVLGDDAYALEGSVRLTVTRAGRLDGICAWFTAELAAGITLTNQPGAPDRIDRRNAMLPIERPVIVRPDDFIDVDLHIIPDDMVVTWTAAVRRPGEDPPLARSRHSTFRGILIADEDLRRTDPDLRPELTAAGLARRTVVDLCDGQRTLREIERLVFERHSTLLGTPADAAVFVSEVVSRYCLPVRASVPPR
jgi:hypothetical protein